MPATSSGTKIPSSNNKGTGVELRTHKKKSPRRQTGVRSGETSTASSSTSTPGSSTNSSGGESAATTGSLPMSLNRMDYASPPKDRPLRGVAPSPYQGRSPNHDRPGMPTSKHKASGAPKRGKPAGGSDRTRSRSADDVHAADGTASGEQHAEGGSAPRNPREFKRSFSDLERKANERFGDKVGPVVTAHLHLQGVDSEDDLRYIDSGELLQTAETSGLKKVQITKLSDWVTEAQQASADLEVRFATSILSVLRSERMLSTLQTERWANKSATALAREFAVLRAEAETARASRGMLDDDGQVVVRAGLAGNVKALALVGDETPSGFNSLTPSEIGRDEELLLQASGGDAYRKYSNKSQQPPPGCLMFNPTAPWRLAWDFLVIMPCLAYLTIVMPFRMCLANEPVGFLFVFEMVMDFIFIFDIFVNFRTGYVDDATGFIVYDYHQVAKQYFRTWFALDVVSGIPFGVMEMEALRKLAMVKVLKSSRILKAVKLMRFLKLSRLIKGLGIMNRIDPDVVDRIEDFLAEGTTRTALRILRIMLIMGLVCHFMACLWVLAGRMADLEGNNSWLAQDFHEFTASDTEHGDKVMKIYLGAYYFAFTTMTTVGYGDVRPYSNQERIVAICLQCGGGFMYAYIISSLTSIVTMEDANAKHARERLDAVASYINKMELPSDLGRRVRRYFRARRTEAMDEGTILMDLSPSLRGEVSAFLVEGGLLSEVPLFKHMAAVYWPRILPLLRPCPLMRGEVVCKEGEDCLESFVVIDGQLMGSTTFGGAPGLDDDASSVASSMADGHEGKDSGQGDDATASQLSTRKRNITQGMMVNVLCLLKVWERSVEKVVAAERTESYAITAEAFYNTFKDDEVVLRSITEHTVNTQFSMDPESPEASTEWGAPLYVLSEAEAALKEVEYALEVKTRRKEMKKHKKANMRRLAAQTAQSKQKGRGENFPLVRINEEGKQHSGNRGLGTQPGEPGAQSALI